MGAVCSGPPPPPKTRRAVMKVVERSKNTEDERAALRARVADTYAKNIDLDFAEDTEVLKAFFQTIAAGEGWDDRTKGRLRQRLWPDPIRELTMEITKIAQFDEVFSKAAAPINAIIGMRDDLEDATNNLKRVCAFAGDVAKITTTQEALAALAKEAAGVRFSVRCTMDPPDFDVTSVSLTGPLAKAVDGAMALGRAVIRVIEKIPDLLRDLQELAEECGEFMSKISECASNAGLGPMEIIHATKATTKNIGRLGKLPGIFRALLAQAKAIFEELRGLANAISNR